MTVGLSDPLADVGEATVAQRADLDVSATSLQTPEYLSMLVHAVTICVHGEDRL